MKTHKVSIAEHIIGRDKHQLIINIPKELSVKLANEDHELWITTEPAQDKPIGSGPSTTSDGVKTQAYSTEDQPTPYN